MSFNWAAENYREIVNECLGYRQKRRPRGAVKHLAEKLRCHSTFISQVLKEQADFSPEQGFELCHHYSFTLEQQDFFLTMLMRDRSGTETLRLFYQKKLDRMLEENRDVGPKSQVEDPRFEAFKSEYFGNWIYQAIHALTQISRFQSVGSMVRALGLPEEEIKAILPRLEAMGLVHQEKTLWKSTQNFLHLSKDSNFVRHLHMTWKTKMLADLQNKSVIDGTRYSGLITVTEKDYHKTRDILVKAIGDIREVVEASSPDGAYILALDCCKLV